jgi:hypothetical protein
MFKYHEYLIPDHYHDSKVLCGERSFAINDILRKLYDEAKSMIKLEIFARNPIIPNQRLVFTPCMRDLLFIMVCRHFAYGRTINKILPFQQDIEELLADNTPFDAVLFKRLHGLLTPFRLPAIPCNAFSDPIEFQHTMTTIASATSADVLVCTAGEHPRLSQLVNIPDFTVLTVFFESPNQFLIPSTLVKFIPSPCS